MKFLDSLQIESVPQRDSLSQLSELLNHGERQGLFGGKMPAQVQQAVREENLRFLKSRDVYCPDYYEFIYELCQVKAALNSSFVIFSKNEFPIIRLMQPRRMPPIHVQYHL